VVPDLDVLSLGAELDDLAHLLVTPTKERELAGGLPVDEEAELLVPALGEVGVAPAVGRQLRAC
jgi:hypothetical protein